MNGVEGRRRNPRRESVQRESAGMELGKNTVFGEGGTGFSRSGAEGGGGRWLRCDAKKSRLLKRVYRDRHLSTRR